MHVPDAEQYAQELRETQRDLDEANHKVYALQDEVESLRAVIRDCIEERDLLWSELGVARESAWAWWAEARPDQDAPDGLLPPWPADHPMGGDRG